jgi:DNA helicase-2/ATP-dependent DNA helicase PcrA
LLGEEVRYFDGDSAYSEANYVATQIKKMIDAKEYAYKDIAILYRSNYLSLRFEQELINNSIPYIVYGGIKFYKRMEIKDILSYLKLIANIEDEVSLKRVLNVPRRNIGMTTIDKISQYATSNNISFYKAMLTTNNVD